MKKLFATILAVTMAVCLAACGSSASGTDSSAEKEAVEESTPETEAAAAEEQAEAGTEQVTETAAVETTETAETVSAEEPAQEPEEEHGPYSDPAAFAGFDSYSVMDRAVTLGVSTFGEMGVTEIERVKQYSNNGHEAKNDPEMLDAGAWGHVVTGYYAKEGGQLSYMVGNPSDAPAAIEDCILTGCTDEEGIIFSNGISWNDSTAEDIIAILGEPYEIRGTVSEDYTSAMYLWCDESGAHSLAVSVFAENELYHITSMEYTNWGLMEE